MSRCPYCSDIKGTRPAWGVRDRYLACERCAPIAGQILLVKQGDGRASFKELMIRQNAREPRRKLLETRSFHFVLFFDDEAKIMGFEMADMNEAHVLMWRRGDRARYFRVSNSGSAYRNHDQMFLNGAFHPDGVLLELAMLGKNIRPEVLQVLHEGVSAYAPPPDPRDREPK